ncbi:MAG: outer membrane protein assembly factor BamD [Panacagrimonas sp.]|jgi:outer membrane protein assembly factor BamD|nr:outer membrane protein assembly factor BamD [Panacagrimonas sp.]MCC2658784.1 outer membrane protein assembly factor BamD [Panacagrimonas sp.]
MKNLFLAATAALALALTACSSNPDKDGKKRPDPEPDRPNVFDRDKQDPLAKRREDRRLSQMDAEQLYRRAHRDMESSDFAGAVEGYDILSERHPFSDYTTQGEIERIYSLYRNFEPERASSSADRFLREHPRHPSVDYIHYLKGLINFDRDESPMNMLPVDESRSDVTSQRRAFDDFALLMQKYPGSRYAADAYARMVYIRNRLASHELHVVDFYIRRGAYVAAAKRAEQVIALYPGTPASYRALEMLVECYELAGLKQQGDDARALLAAQNQQIVKAFSHSSPGALTVATVEVEDFAPAPPPPAAAAAPTAAPASSSWFAPIESDTGPGKFEVVIPSDKSGSTPAPAGTEAADKAAASAGAAAAQAPGAAAAEPSPTRSNRLEIFYESPDDAPAPKTEPKPAAAPAPAQPAP